jgi:hypothetical protein
MYQENFISLKKRYISEKNKKQKKTLLWYEGRRTKKKEGKTTLKEITEELFFSQDVFFIKNFVLQYSIFLL